MAFAFDPNRGISDTLDAQDQLRMRNADRMTQMTLAQMAQAARDRELGAVTAADAERIKAEKEMAADRNKTALETTGRFADRASAEQAIEKLRQGGNLDLEKLRNAGATDIAKINLGPAQTHADIARARFEAEQNDPMKRAKDAMIMEAFGLNAPTATATGGAVVLQPVTPSATAASAKGKLAPNKSDNKAYRQPITIPAGQWTDARGNKGISPLITNRYSDDGIVGPVYDPTMSGEITPDQMFAAKLAEVKQSAATRPSQSSSEDLGEQAAFDKKSDSPKAKRTLTADQRALLGLPQDPVEQAKQQLEINQMDPEYTKSKKREEYATAVTAIKPDVEAVVKNFMGQNYLSDADVEAFSKHRDSIVNKLRSQGYSQDIIAQIMSDIRSQIEGIRQDTWFEKGPQSRMISGLFQ